MHDRFTIGEISKLYGIGTDSIRYYERIGVLTPQRSESGYRLYRLNDLYKISIIRDLLALGFPMTRIKDYLDGQSIENTLALLHEAHEVIQKKRRELAQREKLIRARIVLLDGMRDTPEGVFRLERVKEQPCVRLVERIERDEEMDFAVKRLHRAYENLVASLGNQAIGAVFDTEALAAGKTNVFESIFFPLEDRWEEGTGNTPSKATHDASVDDTVPGGDYLCTYYRGPYRHNGKRVNELLDHAQKANMRMLDAPFELYIIDNRDTSDESEFLTELRVRVEVPVNTTGEA